MNRIVFNKKPAVKSSNIMVRLEDELRQDLLNIAESNDVALTEVSRAFLRAGVEQYKKEGADVED